MDLDKTKPKKTVFLTVASIALVFLFAELVCAFIGRADARESGFGSTERKQIEIIDGGLNLKATTDAGTVADVLDRLHIAIGDDDIVMPNSSAQIFGGSRIIIERAKKITIIENGQKREEITHQTTVEQAVWEQKEVRLDGDDITVPARNALVTDGMKITVTHVLIKEETVEKPIDFKTVTNEDDSLSWRIKKVTQKGEKGINEIRYKIVYYNGKEISRKVLDQNITKDPVNEVVTQGTFVKVGKASTGQASWYAYTGTLSAANPWLPMGSYVKVTNKDNGKSVIVKINDRGPFGPGRIIDLDKVAFAKIADLGQGVANVKMETITN